jgi:hypothetical protein
LAFALRFLGGGSQMFSVKKLQGFIDWGRRIDWLVGLFGGTAAAAAARAVLLSFTHLSSLWLWPICLALAAIAVYGLSWLPFPGRRSVPVDGLLNPIQIDVLGAIKGLRELLVRVGPTPEYIADPNLRDLDKLGAKLFEWKKSLRLWSSKADAQYRLNFASKVDDVRLRISASDVIKSAQAEADLAELDEFSKKKIEVSDDIEKMIDALESIFFNVRSEA